MGVKSSEKVYATGVIESCMGVKKMYRQVIGGKMRVIWMSIFPKTVREEIRVLWGGGGVVKITGNL